MAKKGGRKGGSSAARSAAAKKGWETRRRGGAKSKPAASKRTAASKPAAKSAGKAPASRQSQFASRAQRALGNLKSAKGTFKTYASQPYWQRGLGDQRPYQKALRSEVTAKAALKVYAGKKRPTVSDARVRNTSKARPSSALGAAGYKPLATRLPSSKRAKPAAKPAAKATKRRGAPKTTSARGRALTNQRRAADLVRASRGGKGPSARAVRSVLTAQRARAFYAATGGGKKRSAVKPKSAAKVGKQIRAQGRAKATAARAKVAGRPRSRVVAKPARLRNRSAADQAHRDKTAKQLRSLEKPVRRAIASVKAVGLRAPEPQRLTGKRRVKGDLTGRYANTSTHMRQHFYDQVSTLTRSPSRGKNKLAPDARAAIVRDVVGTAKRLKARAAVAVAKPGRTVRLSGASRLAARPKDKPAAQRPAATARTPRKRVDYAGAVSLGRSQDAARRRLARGEYTATGNGGWSMMWDRRQAKTPTEKLARDRVKGALSELRKWQGTTRNQYASSQMKERAKREIARARKDVIKQVRIARAFRPAYLPETRRRYQASKG